MATNTTAVASRPSTTMASLPCCPEMTPDDTCDFLDFHYRLNYPVTLPRGRSKALKRRGKAPLQAASMPGPFGAGQSSLHEYALAR
jgi:hypothetical protein